MPKWSKSGAQIVPEIKVFSTDAHKGDFLKITFSLEAHKPVKHKFLGTFRSPERANAFFHFCAHFAVPGRLCAKSAPEVKMSKIWLFRPKSGKLRFAILVEKRCPERYVHQGFCASRRKSEIRVFTFPSFSILCRAKKVFLLL